MSDSWKNVKRRGWRLLKATAVLFIVGGIIYRAKFAPVPVASHTIERGTITVEVMGTGTLEARVQTTISPKISGRLVELLVDQGRRVAIGDLLVRLDDEELSQQVAIAQANLSAMEAAIVRLKTDKVRAVAVYTQAKQGYDRRQQLVESNVVSQEDVDVATEALSVAEAGLSRAEAAIAEGQKELVAAEKTLQYHRARLLDTNIHAPFDGLVVKRSRETGDVVVPGSSILTLISTDQLWISAWVDETEMARLQPEQLARVVFRSEPDKDYPGRVVRLGRETDRETREFIVDVRVLELPTNWAVGQRAEAYIQTSQQHDVLLLPARLLVMKENDVGVIVNMDGVARWRPVSIGLRSRDAVEVLGGLAEGDTVVTPQSLSTQLTDGRKVATP